METLWTVVAVLFGVFAAGFLFLIHNFNHWSKRGIAGPKPSLLFGNFKEVLFQTVTPGVYLQNIYKAYPGAPFVGFFIFNKPVLLLRDPDLIKQVLMKDFVHFVDRYADSSITSDSLGTRGMFLSKGIRWRQLRSVLSPAFTSGRMKKMFYLMLECANQLKAHVTERVASDTSPIEVKELMAKTSTDVISTCAFGINTNCISDPNAEFREFGRSIFIYTFRRSLESTSMWFMPWLIKIARFSFYPKETAEFLHRVFWDTIDAREKSGVPRNDVIDQLIQLKNKGKIDDDAEKTTKEPKEEKSYDLGKFNFGGEDLLAQAALFFAAGFETTSSTLSFTLYELALQPAIQTRLRKEINEVASRYDGQVTYDSVIEMKYLDMVIAETLRKYPPLPFLDRICVREYVIPGTDMKIEKGTPIYIPLLGLHYDPDFFPEPDKYDPERFSEEQKHSYPPCSYIPFGEGPRICIGMRFAQIAAKTELASVLARLEVLPCPETPVPLELNPKATLLASVGGIPLLFRAVK